MVIIPDQYVLITFKIFLDISLFALPLSSFPKTGKQFPLTIHAKMGDQFIKDNKFLTMKVPLVIVQGEYNFLINPRHPRIKMLL
jgi:hypothetical protein